MSIKGSALSESKLNQYGFIFSNLCKAEFTRSKKGAWEAFHERHNLRRLHAFGRDSFYIEGRIIHETQKHRNESNRCLDHEWFVSVE